MFFHGLFSPLTLSTFWSVIICHVFSAAFASLLNPGSGDCSFSVNNTIDFYCAIILLPCFLWAMLFFGFVPRMYTRLVDQFSGSRDVSSFHQNLHDALLTSKFEEKTMVQAVFLGFFDRWVVVAIANLVFLPLIAKSKHQDYTLEVQQSVASFFEIWAISALFNDVVSLFRNRHVLLSQVWKLNRAPQSIAIYLALFSIIALVVLFAVGIESNEAVISFLLFTRLERLVLHIYLVFSLGTLLSALNIYNDELLKAVVKSYGLTPTERVNSTDGMDAPFRSQDLSRIENYVSESAVSTESGSAASLQNDYSQVYLESQRIMDLLKMVASVVFISIINDVTSFITVYGSRYEGGSVLSIATKILVFILPWIYIVSYTYSRPVVAVAVARRACLSVSWAILLASTALLGCYLGCDFISDADDRIKDSRTNSFLIFLAKSTALPTTVTFAFTFLTSPSIRSWFVLPQALRYFILPIVWLPPYTLQLFHEASGANFAIMGLVHTIAWVSMVLLGLFSLTVTGVWVATVTGILMLIFSIKLLWPPGLQLPHIKTISWSWYHRVDEFLKDSKYGSYHVYLAAAVFILYIIHGIPMMKFAFSWYFLFACVAFAMLVVAHPGKRHFVASYAHPSYKIVSKEVLAIKQGSLSAVKLLLEPPCHCHNDIFDGCGDIIMLRNWFMSQAVPWLSFLWHHCETVHYFSVVGMKRTEQIVEGKKKRLIEVDLMIQRTKRRDGAASALMDSNPDHINNVDIVGFAKSNSLEVLYTPSIIAFGFESGAAAFCSILKKRMMMRREIEHHSKLVKTSELTDICVVWTPFMRRSRGPVTAEAIVEAISELNTLQRYLYDNSGGKGVKMLFIATGVPADYTPAPECLAHKLHGLEEKVAELCGYSPQIAKLSETWSSTDKLPPDRGSGGQANGLTSFANIFNSDGWGRLSQGRLSTGRSSTNVSRGSSNIGRQSFRSSQSRVSEENGRSSSVDMVAIQRTISPIEPNRLPPIEEGVEEASGHSSMPVYNSAGAGSVSSDYNQSTLKEVRHMFTETKTGMPLATPIEMLLQVQAKEESWVPMRHAFGSSWGEFLRILDYRIGCTLSWLNSSGGPDYTTVFITENLSDLALLRDFKYDIIYDEVNRAIIDHQLKFSKNPDEYLRGIMDDDGDPLNPAATTCSVLYSGDYASSKKARLHKTVVSVRAEQEILRQPALLNFVPDA